MAVATHEASLTTFQPASAAAERPGGRLASLDIARGLVMVLMAVDHVRVYAGVPAGGPTFGVFFTRWITHFSAPAFAFLAGTGAFLLGTRLDRASLSRHLIIRGLLLIALELSVLRLAWTFNTDVAHYNLAGVLWMLGWCMVLLAALVWLPVRVVGVVGVLIVVAQAAFVPVSRALPHAIGAFLYLGGGVQLGANGPPIDILYVIVPWIGVMAAGYAFGALVLRPADERRRIMMRLGIAMTAIFIVLAGAGALLGPSSPNAPPLLFRVLGQRKYPASTLFLLMTLGPTLIFTAAAEGTRGRIAGVLETFGRVPLFFYLLHIPLIHLLAIGVSYVREGAVNPWLFGNHPMEPPPVPPGYRWSLGLLYLVFAVAVTLLYLPCRWFAGVRARDRTGLLRYL